jgi:hypothetical protein
MTLLSVRDAAERLGISVKTLRGHIRNGRLRKPAGACCRYSAECGYCPATKMARPPAARASLYRPLRALKAMEVGE